MGNQAQETGSCHKQNFERIDSADIGSYRQNGHCTGSPVIGIITDNQYWTTFSRFRSNCGAKVSVINFTTLHPLTHPQLSVPKLGQPLELLPGKPPLAPAPAARHEFEVDPEKF